MSAFTSVADGRGHFGEFGGRFVPETLVPALEELSEHHAKAQADPQFQAELAHYLKEFVGRETPLTFAEGMTRELGGAKIYLKREDLCHTGAHKINNTVGQALLARPDHAEPVVEVSPDRRRQVGRRPRRSFLDQPRRLAQALGEVTHRAVGDREVDRGRQIAMGLGQGPRRA